MFLKIQCVLVGPQTCILGFPPL